jgi:dihydroorotase
MNKHILLFFTILLFLISLGCPSRSGAAGNSGETLQPVPEPEPDVTYDLVILGGRVMDPETGYDRVANIGVTGRMITRITENPIKGNTVVDATGLVVSPGFIDTMVACAERNPKRVDWTFYWKVADGVTTAVWSHDGVGFYQETLDGLKDYKSPINYGYGARIMDYHLRKVGTMEGRIAQLRKDLEAGALNIGVSPEYNPWLKYDVLVAYAKVAAEFNVPFGMHLRYSHQGNELLGVEEAINIARDSGAIVYIFHLNSTGGTYHMDKALEMIDAARAEGLKIEVSVYPYSYWMTFISSSRFDPGWEEAYGLTPEDIFFVPEKRNILPGEWPKFRKTNGLCVVPEGTIPWETSTLPALKKDYVHIASDGAYPEDPAKSDIVASHPRDTGNFAQGIRECLDRGIPLMEAIRKSTLIPANLFAPCAPVFNKLGRLQEGCIADIVVFDPETISDGGTVLNPAQVSVGIDTVLVGGKIVCRNGVVTGERPGMLILAGQEATP